MVGHFAKEWSKIRPPEQKSLPNHNFINMYTPQITFEQANHRQKMLARFLKYKNRFELQTFNRTIACDWLQLHCKMPFENYTEWKSSIFVIEEVGHGTQQFKKLYHITQQDGENVAVIAAFPRSECMLKSDSALIKVVNKYLYQKDLEHFVRFLLKELGLGFINVTRIDAALDFQFFDGLRPEKFMQWFADRKIYKRKKSHFKLEGDTFSVEGGKEVGGFESLKFGRVSSNLTYQLYNKSRELANVKEKPWIYEHWRANGYTGTHDVWRLEFNIWSVPDGIALIDLDTGELADMLRFNDLSIISKVLQLWIFFFNQYFTFVFKELSKKGNIKKQSRSEKLVLFQDFENIPGVRIKLSDKKDAGRAYKIFARKLEELNNELRGRDFELSIHANEMITWVVESRDLNQWANKKLKDYRPSERILDALATGDIARFDMAILAANKAEKIFDADGKSIRKDGKRLVKDWEGNATLVAWEDAPF